MRPYPFVRSFVKARIDALEDAPTVLTVLAFPFVLPAPGLERMLTT